MQNLLLWRGLNFVVNIYVLGDFLIFLLLVNNGENSGFKNIVFMKFDSVIFGIEFVLVVYFFFNFWGKCFILIQLVFFEFSYFLVRCFLVNKFKWFIFRQLCLQVYCSQNFDMCFVFSSLGIDDFVYLIQVGDWNWNVCSVG